MVLPPVVTLIAVDAAAATPFSLWIGRTPLGPSDSVVSSCCSLFSFLGTNKEAPRPFCIAPGVERVIFTAKTASLPRIVPQFYRESADPTV